jgi:hypothetical protein
VAFLPTPSPQEIPDFSVICNHFVPKREGAKNAGHFAAFALILINREWKGSMPDALGLKNSKFE